jgi:tetratricopeptide (TPR) repeat protein
MEPNTFLVMRNNLPPRSPRRVKLLSMLRKQLGKRYSRELAEGIARIYIATAFDGALGHEVGCFFSVASLCREALENDDPEPIALLILNKRFMSIMPIFELFIRKHIDFIRSHDPTWKAMAVHYAHTGKFSANLEWTEGWRGRAANFETLASRLTSLHALERFDEARELALEAVERLPFDDGAPDFAAEAYYIFALAEDWSACDRFEAYGELDKKPPGTGSMPGELFAIGKNMREFAESPSDVKIKKAKNLERAIRWRPLPTPKLPAKKARKKFRKWILSLR